MRRVEINVSQAELARRIGSSQQAIASLEGNRTKTFRNLLGLAQVLGVSPTWLATGRGVKDPTLASVDDVRGSLMDFAERVREARNLNGFTVSASCRGIMHEDEWRDLEAGAVWPNPVQLDLICGRLSQSLDWLVRGLVIAHAERPMQGVERVTIHEQPALLRPPRKGRDQTKGRGEGD